MKEEIKGTLFTCDLCGKKNFVEEFAKKIMESSHSCEDDIQNHIERSYNLSPYELLNISLYMHDRQLKCIEEILDLVYEFITELKASQNPSVRP